MSSRKNVFVTLGFVLSVSFISAAVAAWLVSFHYSKTSFDLVNAVCCEVIEQEPETQKIISAALKEYTEGNADGLLEDHVLTSLGYQVSDFSDFHYKQIAFFAAAGLLAGASLFLFTFLYRNRVENKKIRNLAEYLEQVNNGKALILSTSGEDDFSKLEDEIYKTVTFLYQTKDRAVQVKNDFAENLSNIAHQIKTPITAISLASQRMKQDFDPDARNRAAFAGQYAAQRGAGFPGRRHGGGAGKRFTNKSAYCKIKRTGFRRGGDRKRGRVRRGCGFGPDVKLRRCTVIAVLAQTEPAWVCRYAVGLGRDRQARENRGQNRTE